jgi:DtxR family Mn-dependent transcriptional regulator
LISKHKKAGWVSNSEISEHLDIKPASVSGMLHKLKQNGFINWKPRSSIRLTKKGKDVAQQIIKNYKKLRQFFAGILKIEDKELIDSLSCGIEHHMTPEVAEALDNLLA